MISALSRALARRSLGSVAVIGASGGAGARVCRLLEANPNVADVSGFDQKQASSSIEEFLVKPYDHIFFCASANKADHFHPNAKMVSEIAQSIMKAEIQNSAESRLVILTNPNHEMVEVAGFSFALCGVTAGKVFGLLEISEKLSEISEIGDLPENLVNAYNLGDQDQEGDQEEDQEPTEAGRIAYQNLQENYQLKITGHNLPVADLTTSDPFFILNSRSVKEIYKSEVINMSLNPTWKDFQLTSDDIFADSLADTLRKQSLRQPAEEPSDLIGEETIQVLLQDSDLMRPDDYLCTGYFRFSEALGESLRVNLFDEENEFASAGHLMVKMEKMAS